MFSSSVRWSYLFDFPSIVDLLFSFRSFALEQGPNPDALSKTRFFVFLRAYSASAAAAAAAAAASHGDDASSRNILEEIVRPRARDFISENPQHHCVTCLSDEESADIDEDGIDITDQQARNFALCFNCDFLFWGVPSSTARLVDSGGRTRYLDERTCRRVLRTRRNDVANLYISLSTLPATTRASAGRAWNCAAPSEP